MDKIYIGIDPDIDKSGFAMIIDKKLSLRNLRFFEIYQELLNLKNSYPRQDLLVVIEAGWLNTKANWHNEVAGVRVASKIGLTTGANHEVGRKLVEMCEFLCIPHMLSIPKTSKINALTFEKLTKYHGRTNQEMRDAAMLIFGR